MYWIDQCVRYCDRCQKSFGIELKSLPMWKIHGLEEERRTCIRGYCWRPRMATLVFMNLEEHEDGDIEIKD